MQIDVRVLLFDHVCVSLCSVFTENTASNGGVMSTSFLPLRLSGANHFINNRGASLVVRWGGGEGGASLVVRGGGGEGGASLVVRGGGGEMEVY